MHVAVDAEEEHSEDCVELAEGIVAACYADRADFRSSYALRAKEEANYEDKVLDEIEETSCNAYLYWE